MNYQQELLDMLSKLDLNPYVPKSYNQILDHMINDFKKRTPIMDLQPGSVMHTLLETIAIQIEKK